MPFVQSRGVRIHYEVEGTGPGLVFQTGAGGDLEMWRLAGYMDRLTEFRRILIDQRGRGLSDRPTELEAHRVELGAEDVAAVLDAESVDSAGFWGYSNGIIAGIAFGAMFPHRLRCLVGTGMLRYRDVCDLPQPDPEPSIREAVAAGGVIPVLEKHMAAESERFPPEIDRNVRATDPLMYALDGVAWMRWKGPKSALGQLRAPLLLLTGEREDPERATERTVAAVPGARMARIAGVGHLGAFYRSELAVPVAFPFLREHLR
jgi:pimeloyl-ACP methyl ester carboxylesterase